MGFFWWGMPDYLIEWSVDVLGSNAVFIETGTYRGDSAARAARSYPRVHTVELSPELAARAQHRFRGTHVTCHAGDSREVLTALLPESATPVMLWLDAHYSGGVTAGSEDRCPLLDEVDIIVARRAPATTIVAIDDVRCFTGSGGFPALDEVVKPLTESGWRWLLIDDMVIATTGEQLARLAQTHASWRTSEAGSVHAVWGVVRLAARVQDAAGRARHRRSGPPG